MTESQPDLDRIAKEATLKGIDESIQRYLQRVEELSTQYRLLADELYPPEQEGRDEQEE